MNGLRDAISDVELVEFIRNDDEAAFRVLYDRYWQVVFSTAFSWLRDRETCMTVVHDIFLGIWNRRNTLQIDHFPQYLTAAARYYVYKTLKHKGRLKIVYLDPIQAMPASPTHNEGEHSLQYRELQDIVEMSLQQLPPRCREIYQMSRKEQLSIKEIAERLDISSRTVENQLTRALQHIRNALAHQHIHTLPLCLILLLLYF